MRRNASWVLLSFFLLYSCGWKGPPYYSKPQPPGVTEVFAALELGNVTLYWSYHGPQVEFFRVYRGTRRCPGCLGEFKEVVPLRRGSYYCFVDKEIRPGDVVCYRVVPISGGGEFGIPSSPFCFEYNYIPPPPKGVKVRVLGSGFELSWKPRENVSGYNIYKVEKGGFIRLNKVLVRGDTYAVFAVPGTYRLCVSSVYVAKGVVYEGPCSRTVEVKVSRLLPPPPPVELSAVPYEGGVFVTWNPGGPGDYVYHVYRSEDGVIFTRLTEKPTGKIFFMDKSVEKGRIYYYKVRAFYRGIKAEGSIFSKVVKVKAE